MRSKVILFALVLIPALSTFAAGQPSLAQTIPPPLPTITYDAPGAYLKLCPECVFLPVVTGPHDAAPAPDPDASKSLVILSSSYDKAQRTVWVEVLNTGHTYFCDYIVVAKVFLEGGFTIESAAYGGHLYPWEKGAVAIRIPDIQNVDTFRYELQVRGGSWNTAPCYEFGPFPLEVESVDVKGTDWNDDGINDMLQVFVTARNPYLFLVNWLRLTATLYDVQGVIVGVRYASSDAVLLPGESISLEFEYFVHEYPVTPASIYLSPEAHKLN